MFITSKVKLLEFITNNTLMSWLIFPLFWMIFYVVIAGLSTFHYIPNVVDYFPVSDFGVTFLDYSMSIIGYIINLFVLLLFFYILPVVVFNVIYIKLVSILFDMKKDNL